ncbi:MAG TPA: hypothetical protein VKY74_19225 [Chloroflexia bacterium]|nr:hypothetical protein [Chloroflexia bacterium]
MPGIGGAAPGAAGRDALATALLVCLPLVVILAGIALLLGWDAREQAARLARYLGTPVCSGSRRTACRQTMRVTVRQAEALAVTDGPILELAIQPPTGAVQSVVVPQPPFPITAGQQLQAEVWEETLLSLQTPTGAVLETAAYPPRTARTRIALATGIGELAALATLGWIGAGILLRGARGRPRRRAPAPPAALP